MDENAEKLLIMSFNTVSSAVDRAPLNRREGEEAFASILQMKKMVEDYIKMKKAVPPATAPTKVKAAT